MYLQNFYLIYWKEIWKFVPFSTLIPSSPYMLLTLFLSDFYCLIWLIDFCCISLLLEVSVQINILATFSVVFFSFRKQHERHLCTVYLIHGEECTRNVYQLWEYDCTLGSCCNARRRCVMITILIFLTKWFFFFNNIVSFLEWKFFQSGGEYITHKRVPPWIDFSNWGGLVLYIIYFQIIDLSKMKNYVTRWEDLGILLNITKFDPVKLNLRKINFIAVKANHLLWSLCSYLIL